MQALWMPEIVFAKLNNVPIFKEQKLLFPSETDWSILIKMSLKYVQT